MRVPQGGVSLVIVMILSLALGTLAVAAMTAAVASLALASHAEQAALAFRAAEAGIEATLETGTRLSPGTEPWPEAAGRASVTTWIVRDETPDGDLLQHAAVIAEGRAGRNVVVRLEQGFVNTIPLRRTSWRPLPSAESP
jgi:hypothetical protein